MQKSILILLLNLLMVNTVLSQCPPPTFSLPDSICSGVPFQIINNPTPGFTYEWDVCIGDLMGLPSGQNLGNNSLLSAWLVKPIIDNGNRYLFISDRVANNIKRYDFGSSYENTPTVHSYGNPGNFISAPIGLEIINENGIWYGFVTGTANTNLIRFNLGTDISSNTFNVDNLGNVGLNSSRNLKAISDGVNKFLFSSNSGGDILTRVEFGSSFGNAPVNFINLSNAAYTQGIGIDIVYDCVLDKYIGFYSNNTNAKIQKLDFGNSLTNTPTILASIQTPNPVTGIQFIRDGLNWHLMTYLTTGSIGGILQNYSFGNNLLNTPALVFSDTIGSVNAPYSIGIIKDASSFYAFANSINPITISRVTWPEQCNSTPSYSTDPAGPVVTLSGFGYHKIAMTVTTSSGIRSTYIDSIFLSPAPTSSFTPLAGCEGLPIQFTDGSTIGTGSIVSWEWDFGDGSPFSNLQNPIHNFSGTGTFNVNLTTESDAGCENTFTTAFTMNPNPVANFSFLNNQCQNSEVTFNDLSQASGGTSVVSWLWDFGDGSLPDTDQNPSHIFSNTGTFTVQLNIETDAGCIDSMFQDITIIPSPETAFLIASTCIGDSVIFTNLTSIQGGGSIVYDWNFGDSNNSNQISPVHQYPLQTGNYDVTLIATASNGCADSITENIRISNRPVPQFSWAPLIVCQGNQVNFTNVSTGTGGDTISAYMWDFGGQGISSLENPVFSFPDTGYYDVTLVAISPTYCDSAIVQQVYVIPSPVASFTASSVCLNGTTSFNPLVTTPTGTVVDSIIWDFGDGTIINSLSSPTHFYTTPGVFGVTMTVYNDLLCTGFYADSVVVYPLPSADFNVPLICTNAIIEFDGTLSTVTNDIVNGWLWDFGGLGSSSDSIPQFVFQNPGTYNITLIASTINGCTDTVIKSVTAIQSPDFTFIFNEPCLGSSAGFTYISNIIPVPPSNLLWDFGDGTLSSVLSPSHVYTMSDSFTVALYVLNPNTGCSSTQINQIYVKPVPEPGFMVNDNCEDQPFQFTDTSFVQSGSIVSWNWGFGILGSSALQNPTITPSVAGNYPVSLTVTSDQGCLASLNSSFTVYARPEANFTPDPLYGSPPLPVTFINNTTGGTSFTWDFGDGSFGTGQAPTHIYPDTGTYTVTMVASSAEGCVDTSYNTLAVLIPYLDIAVTNVYTTIENNKLKLSARLTNQGNIAITEFTIKGTIENGSSISEKWEGVLGQGVTLLYEFVASYEISDTYTLGFFCIEAIDPNNAVDQNLSNNKKCSAIETEFEIFTIFPNPFSSELNINFNLNTEGPYRIEMHDEIGKLVFSSETFSGLKGFNTKKINTPSFSVGYYTITLRFRDETRFHKAIKINN